MSVVRSTANVNYIAVADLGEMGHVVVKHHETMMQRHHIGTPTDRTTAIANAVRLSASLGWPLDVNL